MILGGVARTRLHPLAVAEWKSVKEENLVGYALRPPGIIGPYNVDIKTLKAGYGYEWC